MYITKSGYIDSLDYNKVRNKEEQENFNAVYNIFYNSPIASEEEIQSTIDLFKKYHNLELKRV